MPVADNRDLTDAQTLQVRIVVDQDDGLITAFGLSQFADQLAGGIAGADDHDTDIPFVWFCLALMSDGRPWRLLMTGLALSGPESADQAAGTQQ